MSERQKIIQEQAKQIEGKEKEGKKILAATENLKESERSQAEMAKKLEGNKAASSRATKKLSEKQKIIQEQANLIKEIEKETISDASSAKYKAILAAAEKLEQKGRAYAEMAKRLDDTEALSTQAANDLSQKEKIIQEQKKANRRK